MKRWGLVFALLLSVGVNAGVLGTIALHRLRPPAAVSGSGGPDGTGRARPGAPDEERGERGHRGDRGEHGEREPRVPQQRIQRLAGRMGLEGEARQRFLAQQRRFFFATTRERLRLARVHAELRRELTSAEPDRDRIEELIREAGRSYLALEQTMVRNVIATREMLTPEQEEVFLDFISRLGPNRLAPPTPGERPFRRRPRLRDGL